MAGTDNTGGYGGINVPGMFNGGSVGGGPGVVGSGGLIPWRPASIRDPFQFSGKPMSPAEAQAAIANAVANPIAPVPWTKQGPRYRNGYHIEDVRIEDQQEQKPENPGRRYVTASTWGRTIPISMGRRRLEGNILQSSALVPKLEGTTEYEVVYEIPIYEDPLLPPEGAITVTYPGDDRPRPSPGSESGCSPNGPAPCDTRSSPTESAADGIVITVTFRDPSPTDAYTVDGTLAMDAGSGSIETADCPALVSCFGQVTLTGSGIWQIHYGITSSNPGPGTELEVDVSSNSGSGSSLSGLPNGHDGVITIGVDGGVIGMT